MLQVWVMMYEHLLFLTCVNIFSNIQNSDGINLLYILLFVLINAFKMNYTVGVN